MRFSLTRLELQQRLESTDWGQALISALIIVTVLTVVVTNLPDSYIKRQIERRSSTYLDAVGLDQGWSVFAPDSRRKIVHMEARVRYADGTTSIWRPPRGGALLGEYWDYHWRKWFEVVVESPFQQLWQPAAQFIVRQEQGKGRAPKRVTLIQRSQELRAPGVPGPRLGPEKRTPYYTYRVPEQGSP